MENINEKKELGAKLREKISLLDEFLRDGRVELERLLKEAQRLEDYSQGSKDTIQRIENHINLQKKEILELRIKQQLNLEAFNFIDAILNSTLAVIKKNSLESEKLSLTKKIELSTKQAEFVKLSSQRDECVNDVNKLEITIANDGDVAGDEIKPKVAKKTRKNV